MMKDIVENYSIVLSPAEEGGYTVTVPSLPGCVTEGDTLQEALANARDAIKLTVQALTERGETDIHEYAPAFTSIVTI